jgi:hypothetical protein
MLTEVRNFKINDVTINYPKLDKPVNPFGTEQYELQIATADETKVQELEENYVMFRRKDGALVKDAAGMFTASLKRKAHKANGDTNGKVRVVNSDLTPMESVTTIGNGSKANVIVFQYPYDTAGRKGVASSLTAIQITDLVVYAPTGGVDFEAVGSIEPTAEVQGSPSDLF